MPGVLAANKRLGMVTPYGMAGDELARSAFQDVQRWRGDVPEKMFATRTKIFLLGVKRNKTIDDFFGSLVDDVYRIESTDDLFHSGYDSLPRFLPGQKEGIDYKLKFTPHEAIPSLDIVLDVVSRITNWLNGEKNRFALVASTSPTLGMCCLACVWMVTSERKESSIKDAYDSLFNRFVDAGRSRNRVLSLSGLSSIARKLSDRWIRRKKESEPNCTDASKTYKSERMRALRECVQSMSSPAVLHLFCGMHHHCGRRRARAVVLRTIRFTGLFRSIPGFRSVNDETFRPYMTVSTIPDVADVHGIQMKYNSLQQQSTFVEIDLNNGNESDDGASKICDETAPEMTTKTNDLLLRYDVEAPVQTREIQCRLYHMPGSLKSERAACQATSEMSGNAICLVSLRTYVPIISRTSSYAFVLLRLRKKNIENILYDDRFDDDDFCVDLVYTPSKDVLEGGEEGSISKRLIGMMCAACGYLCPLPSCVQGRPIEDTECVTFPCAHCGQSTSFHDIGGLLRRETESDDAKAEVSVVSDRQLCVICQSDIYDDCDVRTLSCTHAFHTGCLGRWLEIKRTCPICHKEVP